jgi:enoyl-CoA hydratase/carnithine racemase
MPGRVRCATKIVRCLDTLAQQAAIQVVVFTGAGPAFAQAVGYHRKVYTFPKPLLAAVNGPALAGGMDLAVMGDVRIAAETATFGQPQVRLGIPAAYDLLRTGDCRRGRAVL